MSTTTLHPGQTVRIKPNTSNVPPGTIGQFLRVHPESGNPLVAVDGRPVAFLMDQIEPAGQASAAREPAPERPESPVRPATPVPRAPAPPPPTATPKAPVAYDWTRLAPQRSYATFSQRGIRLSERAARFVADSDFVEILYDIAHRAIGIRPVVEESEETFSIVRTDAETLVRVRQQLQELLDKTVNGRVAIHFTASWDAAAGILVVTGVPFRKDAA